MIQYLRSLKAFKAVLDAPDEKLREILKEHMKDGAIDLPKDYGMFIARRRA